jgi:hypothetical protein
VQLRQSTKGEFMNINEMFPAKPTSLSKEDLTAEELRNQIIKRCSDANIPVKEMEDFDDEIYLVLEFPAGRSKRKVYLYNIEEFEKFLKSQFNSFVILGDYIAICSYQHNYIEASIGSIQQPTLRFLMHRLSRERLERGEELDFQNFELTINKTPSESNQKITISIGSALLHILGSIRSEVHFSIKIEGIPIAQNDQAIELLQKVTNSLFFEIDQIHNINLNLVRDKKRRVRPLFPYNKNLETAISFPKNEYENKPISLYWYARNAQGLPLLQYLAYYQSIEYFFPIFSQNEAKRVIRNILKTPGFTAHKDSDVIKILSAIKSSPSRGYGDERSQLRATIQECLDQDSLKHFILSNEEMKDFFAIKYKAVSNCKVSITSASASTDLRLEVAERIYDIRCKIVHTKSGGNEGEDFDLLLPYSKEADLLEYDIELIQYVARQVLIASSRDLTL